MFNVGCYSWVLCQKRSLFIRGLRLSCGTVSLDHPLHFLLFFSFFLWFPHLFLRFPSLRLITLLLASRVVFVLLIFGMVIISPLCFQAFLPFLMGLRITPHSARDMCSLPLDRALHCFLEPSLVVPFTDHVVSLCSFHAYDHFAIR